MPLYEYQCESCSNRFEKIQKFSDPLVDVCPKCGGPVKKLPSSPAIQFKGSGWSITDYAKKSSSEASTTSSDSKPSSDSKSSSSETSTTPAAAPSSDTSAKKSE